MPWQPILEGPLKERAWESVRAIVADLESWGREPLGDPSLAGGTTGLAILHGYLAQTGPEPESAAIARRCLEHATASLAEQPGTASLYSGLTGVGWGVAHLQGRLPGLDGEDDLAEIDEILLDHLNRSPLRGEYDLIEGLVGFGVYALERLPRPAAAACLERRGRSTRRDGRAPRQRHHLVDRSGVAPLRDPRGVPPRLLQPGLGPRGSGRDRPARAGLSPRGWPRTRRDPCSTARSAGCWSRTARTSFPFWIGPGAAGDRRGWPGVTAIRASPRRCSGRPAASRSRPGSCRRWASPRRAAQRPSDESGVRDACLCHGGAGLAHLFNRMFQATAEPELAQAARSWFERTLAMRRPGRGVGGYEAWQAGEDTEMTWVTDPGLLNGAAGIALALVAATTSIEPLWDRMLLVSIPPRAAS